MNAAGDRALQAWLHVEHFRGLRLASLQRTALASLPVWLGARWTLPSLLAWLAVLLHASFAVEVVAYAWLEHLFVRRARAVNAAPSVALHFPCAAGRRLASGLWYGAGVTSLVPWLGVTLGRAALVSVRPVLPLLAALMSILVLAACALDGVGHHGSGSHDPSAGAAGKAKVMKPSLRRT